VFAKSEKKKEGVNLKSIVYKNVKCIIISLSLLLSEQEDKQQEKDNVESTEGNKNSKVSPAIVITPTDSSFVVIVTHGVLTVIAETSLVRILEIAKTAIIKEVSHVLSTSLAFRSRNLEELVTLAVDRDISKCIDDKTFNHIMIRI
jgi:hypothetical protein